MNAARFLFDEARLLDHARYRDWLALISRDIDYRVPVRRSVMNDAGDGFSDTAFFMEEDYASLALRVERLESAFAWSENPRTRTRRIVANVIEDRLDSPSELDVTSNLVVYCHRGEDPTPRILTAERRDRLLMRPQGWQLKCRRVLLDTTVLGLESLSILL